MAVDLFASNVEQAILGDARGLVRRRHRTILATHDERKKPKSAGLLSLNEKITIVPYYRDGRNGSRQIQANLSDQTATATSQLVELKALDAFYPLYGKLIVEPAQTSKKLLAPIQAGCQSSPLLWSHR